MILSPLKEKGERHVTLHGNPGRSSDMPSEILQLFSSLVTGAKSGAGFEILLAPTRVWSIQPDCDRPF